MAIYKRDIVDINLETGNIHRSFLKHSIGYLDQQADRFGIRTYRDGAPVDLSGVSVQGIFMPPQGSPISITGVQYTSVIGNEAIVVLPQACYNYDGQFTLAIKLVDSTNAITGTMRIIDGMVDNTHASGTVAPTSAVPTYQEILATYDAMVAATAATNASLANYYSDLPSRIPAGTYCIYNNILYRCISPIASRGAWDATKWVEAKLANDTSDIKSAIDSFDYLCEKVLTPVGNWATGYYKNDGTYDSWTKAIRTKTWVFTSAKAILAFAPVGYYIKVFEYMADGTFVAKYGEFNPSAGHQTPFVFVKTTAGYKYRFVVGFFDDSSASSHLTDAFIGQVKICELLSPEEINFQNRLTIKAWKVGNYNVSTGNYEYWSRAICTNVSFVPNEDCHLKAYVDGEYGISITEHDEDGVYVNTYGIFNSASSTNSPTRTVIVSAKKGHIYNFSVGTFANNTAANYLTSAFIEKIHMYTDLPSVNYDIVSTNDNTDRTQEIMDILSSKGSCSFGEGLFCTSGIIMPGSSMITGCGNDTEIRLLSVEDGDIWTFGDQTFTQEVVIAFGQTLPAGRYYIKADIVSTDTDAQTCTVTLYKGSPYTTVNKVGQTSIERGTGKEAYINATEPFTAICFYASSYYAGGEGDTATYSNITFKANPTAIVMGSDCTIKNIQLSGSDEEIEVPSSAGTRHGIGYYGVGSSSEIKRGVIDGCFIHGFTGGGLSLFNTGYGVQGLNISNCYVYNCYAGFYDSYWSEFHRISNCSFTNNYIGAVNNGGNNQFSGCNFSANNTGLLMSSTHNGAHGGCSGCIFQHNKTSIYIDDQASGFVFVGCNIDPDESSDKGLVMNDSWRIIFNGCNFMNYFNITVKNGGLLLFNGCNFRTDMVSKTSITNNNAVRFVACYTAGGALVDPTQA